MTLDTSIECVLFDLDGTLIDTAPDFVKVVQRLCAEHERPAVSTELIYQTVSDGARALVKLAFGIAEDHPDFPGLHQRLLDIYEEQLQVTDAVVYQVSANYWTSSRRAAFPGALSPTSRYATPACC